MLPDGADASQEYVTVPPEIAERAGGREIIILPHDMCVNLSAQTPEEAVIEAIRAYPGCETETAVNYWDGTFERWAMLAAIEHLRHTGEVIQTNETHGSLYLPDQLGWPLSAEMDTGPADYPLDAYEGCTPDHARILRDSAISPEVAKNTARSGACEADNGKRKSPSLAFGYYHPDDTTHLVHRLDTPFVGKDGKTIRYLAQKGARGLQTHPLIRDYLHTPSYDLVVVEGTKQTLAVVTALRGRKVAVVGINGIRGWCWNPGAAPGTPLPDWGFIPLRGRRVFTVPDGDWTTKDGVRDGADALEAFLRGMGASDVHRVSVPMLPGQDNTGADDYLASLPLADRQQAVLQLLDEARQQADDESQDGWDFLASDDVDEPPIWGHEKGAALWSSGESLMIVGPPGAGKSTLAHLVVFARLGLLAEVVGHDVVDDGGKVLYLAMDRPKQIQRAMRRLVRPEHETTLRTRLVVHRGPLPFSVTEGAGQTRIRDWARSIGATTVVVDSIKDVLPDASAEESAGNYNLARQSCLAAGIEWIELHHNRKANGTNKEPNTLEDVYGARWITAGAGSVISLWQDEPGSPLVSLRHIRAAGEKLFDTPMVLDPVAGTLEARATATLEDHLKQVGKHGTTVAAAAEAIHGLKVKPGQVEAVRNKLKRMKDNGKVEIVPREGGDLFTPADDVLMRTAIKYRLVGAS